MKSKYLETQRAQTWRNLTSLIAVLLWLSGCASAPIVLTEYETVEIEVPVRIPVPDSLLRHPAACTLPPGEQVYIFDMDEWISCAVDSLIFYYEQTERIRELQQ